MVAIPSGWGGGEWGAAPWGSGAADLTLVDVHAVSENVVRFTFSDAPVYTGLLGVSDAARPGLYQVLVVGGVGLDGEPCRPVRTVLATVADVPNAAGSAIDVTVDRPLTAYPAQYRGTVQGLVSAEGAFLMPGASRVFYGMRAEALSASAENAVASTDIANPQSIRDLIGLSPANANEALGTYQVAPDGDYAQDTPISSYRKRVYRRLTSKKSGFLHLPGYGVGFVDAVKQPARKSVRELLAQQAEQQIQLEPETLNVSVRVTTLGSVTVYRITALTKLGTTAVNFDVPISIGG